jgi:hypothetical protein
MMMEEVGETYFWCARELTRRLNSQVWFASLVFTEVSA